MRQFVNDPKTRNLGDLGSVIRTHDIGMSGPITFGTVLIYKRSVRPYATSDIRAIPTLQSSEFIQLQT